MKKHILVVMALVLMHISSFGQGNKDKDDSEVTFLPHYKGEVVNKISGIPSSNAAKVFSDFPLGNHSYLHKALS